MRKIDQLLSEYGESHQDNTNKTIHWICVPLIFFSITGLIWSIPHQSLSQMFPASVAPFVNWATLALIFVLVYYFSLSPPLFMGMAVVVTLIVWLTYGLEKKAMTPLWLISIIILVVAWIGQFYGHSVEGKKPSFFKDVQFLLIGPAWLMHFIYKRLRIPY